MMNEESLDAAFIHKAIEAYRTMGLLQNVNADALHELKEKWSNKDIKYHSVNSILANSRGDYFYFDEENYFIEFSSDKMGCSHAFEKLVLELAGFSHWFFCPTISSIKFVEDADYRKSVLRFSQDGSVFESTIFEKPAAHIYAIAELVNRALNTRYVDCPNFYVVDFDDGGGVGFLLLTRQCFRDITRDKYLRFHCLDW